MLQIKVMECGQRLGSNIKNLLVYLLKFVIQQLWDATIRNFLFNACN